MLVDFKRSVSASLITIGKILANDSIKDNKHIVRKLQENAEMSISKLSITIKESATLATPREILMNARDLILYLSRQHKTVRYILDVFLENLDRRLTSSDKDFFSRFIIDDGEKLEIIRKLFKYLKRNNFKSTWDYFE